MQRSIQIVGMVAIVAALGSVASAVNIETVPVGNVGNTGEWSGESYGGLGPDRICGAVNYEYKIGKYEVTAGQYTEFLNKTAGVDTYGLYYSYMSINSIGCQIRRYAGSGTGEDPYRYTIGGEFLDRPVNYISWGDAARFANWLHNGQPNDDPLTTDDDALTTEDGSYYLNGATSKADLLAVTRKPNATWVIPTEDEWYKAAYYKGGGTNAGYWNYPTSKDSTPSNDLDSGGNSATFSIDDSDYTIGSPYWRTEVGEHEHSESPYATFDQGGNVKEWNEAILSNMTRGLRGGSFADSNETMHALWRLMGSTTYEGYKRGFRLVEVPEPATLSLLALGGLAMLRRQRTRLSG